MKNIKLGCAVLAGWLLVGGHALAEPCGLPGLPACDIPEPDSLALIVLGVVAAAIIVRLRKK